LHNKKAEIYFVEKTVFCKCPRTIILRLNKATNKNLQTVALNEAQLA